MSEERAFAFGYDKEEPAPRLLAAGKGWKARRILEIAEQAGVPLVVDPDLAELVDTLRVGDWIPEALFQAFAELMAGIYRLNKNEVSRELL